MNGILVVKYHEFKEKAEREISLQKLRIEEYETKIEVQNDTIHHYIIQEKEFKDKLDEAAEQYNILYDELDKLYQIQEENANERLEGTGKWRHLELETDPIIKEDKSIFVELIVQHPEPHESSKLIAQNKEDKSDSRSKSARANSRVQKKGKTAKFNIKGLIASKGVAKKLKKKAKHKQKLSENKLSKIRSKIREHENISLSSKSSKSNIKSISPRNSLRNDEDELPIMYPTLTIDTEKGKAKLVTIPIEIDNPLEVRSFKRSKSFSKQRTGKLKKLEDFPKIEVNHIDSQNNKIKKAITKINVKTDKVNRTFMMKYKGKLKELLPTHSEIKKNDMKVAKASSQIKRLIAIAAARKFCPYKF